MRTDGSVIIDTKILDDGMEKGFERIKSDVGSVADEAQKAARNISAEFSKMDVSRPVADAMRKVADLERQLESVTAEHKFAIAEDDNKGAERLARKMTSIYDRLEAARERLAREVEKAAHKQAKAEEKAAERSRRAAEKEAKSKEKAMNKAYKSATKGARRFGSRLSEILSGALIFNAISSGLRNVTSYFGEALKTNEQYRESVGKLKGALLTAFQPIYEYVVPAIVKMVNYLTVGAQAVAQFFATISGKNVKQMAQNAEQLYEEAKGMDAVAESAEEAKRQLMGFDEINKLSEQKTSGTETETDKSTISPIFGETEASKDMLKDLENILAIVSAVGAALLTWKIASAFTDSLSLAAGLGLSVGGALMYAYGFADAFANGIDWGNLGIMLAGMVTLAGGLKLAFGPVGAAIGLIVSSVGLAVLAIKDWIETGELSNEGAAAIVAAFAGIGAAIALLTGGWIPLLIGAFAGFVFGAITKGDELKTALDKLSDWLWNIFGRDWTELFGPFLGGIMNSFVESVAFYWGSVRDIFKGIIDFIQGVFTGDWEQALNGLLQIGKTTLNALIRVINKMISSVIDKINSLFRILSFNLDLPNGKSIGWNLPQFKAPQIPYLATGAVIPPNAPFMAVLGDQKNGTNIEAPADLIRQIVREELAGMNGNRTDELLRELISVVENISVGDETIGRAAERYNRRAIRTGGY